MMTENTQLALNSQVFSTRSSTNPVGALSQTDQKKEVPKILRFDQNQLKTKKKGQDTKPRKISFSREFINFKNQTESEPKRIPDVFYVPEFEGNLLPKRQASWNTFTTQTQLTLLGQVENAPNFQNLMNSPIQERRERRRSCMCNQCGGKNQKLELVKLKHKGFIIPQISGRPQRNILKLKQNISKLTRLARFVQTSSRGKTLISGPPNPDAQNAGTPTQINATIIGGTPPLQFFAQISPNSKYKRSDTRHQSVLKNNQFFAQLFEKIHEKNEEKKEEVNEDFKRRGKKLIQDPNNTNIKRKISQDYVKQPQFLQIFQQMVNQNDTQKKQNTPVQSDITQDSNESEYSKNIQKKDLMLESKSSSIDKELKQLKNQVKKTTFVLQREGRSWTVRDKSPYLNSKQKIPYLNSEAEVHTQQKSIIMNEYFVSSQYGSQDGTKDLKGKEQILCQTQRSQEKIQIEKSFSKKSIFHNQHQQQKQEIQHERQDLYFNNECTQKRRESLMGQIKSLSRESFYQSPQSKHQYSLYASTSSNFFPKLSQTNKII